MHKIPSIFQFDRIFVSDNIFFFFFNDTNFHCNYILSLFFLSFTPRFDDNSAITVAENAITMCNILQKIGKIRRIGI